MKFGAPTRGQNGISVSSSLLLLVVLVLAADSSLGLKQITLRDVCLNRQVPIGSLDEISRLIGELKAKPAACLENYRQSFYELEQLLVVDNQELTLCGEQKFDQIKQFHFRYIQPSAEMLGKLSDADYKQRLLVPVALAQFFKAWALQVSGTCKRTLVANLDKATQLLTASDYELLEGKTLRVSPKELRASSNLFRLEPEEEDEDEEATKKSTSKSSIITKASNFFTWRGFGLRKSETKQVESAPVAPQGGGGGGGGAGDGKRKQYQYDLSFQRLVYMPELEGELVPGDIERMQTPKMLYLRSKSELNKFMHTCERRFRPIYSKLILPLVRLSKLGYDYVGPALKDIKTKLFTDPLVAQWMLVTMVCESQGRVELAVAPGHAPKQLLEYKPIYNYKLEGNLWVTGSEALRLEQDRTRKEHSTGLKKLLYKAGLKGRKAVEKVDPLQYAWYRKNQAMLSSFLITTSILSGILNKSVNLSG